MTSETTVRLEKPVERVVSEGHPWIYRAALRNFEARPGEVVKVLSRRGEFLARGYADGGPIGVRVMTTRDEPVDAGFVRRRLMRAAELRRVVVPEETDAYRLVHGEGDRLPGVVVDVYGPYAVLRLDGEGAEARRDELLEPLKSLLGSLSVETLLCRTGRRKERRMEVLWGDPPPDTLEVREHGMVLVADLMRGQKTGLFLDHREARFRTRALSKGRRVLNLYSYTGGFSVAAGIGGASAVTSVDVAPGAIDFARRTWTANGLPDEKHEAIAADVPAYLEGLGRGAPFDLIISDPPSFAPNEKSVPTALESYRSLHARCLSRLAPGGLFIAASCSSHVDRVAFDATVRDGARKAGRILQVLDRWGAPPDHPRLLAFPEGDYLKTLVARVL